MNNLKIGRNLPCPCGSGKKYKKCCEPIKGAAKRVSKPAIEEFRERVMDHERKEREHIARFGEVKPQIALDYKGFKVVAVGSRICWSKNWRFFPDFLIDYIGSLVGNDWRKTELSKSARDAHPILNWWRGFAAFSKNQQRNADGFFEAALNGPASAFVNLAYDLYTVDHNGRLDDQILRRLKLAEQFQGARYEVFAEATCLRAGFVIEHENEKDGTTKHAEFVATHRRSGQRLAVEAKSKHRPGILGRPGDAETGDDFNLRFGGLLNEAMGKTHSDPLVVFLDTNLPPDVASQRVYKLKSPYSEVPFKLINSQLDRIREKHGGADPYNGIIFTNFPHHYGRDEEPDPQKHFMAFISQMPSYPMPHTSALTSLIQAVNLYGRIPSEFPAKEDA